MPFLEHDDLLLWPFSPLRLHSFTGFPQEALTLQFRGFEVRDGDEHPVLEGEKRRADFMRFYVKVIEQSLVCSSTVGCTD